MAASGLAAGGGSYYAYQKVVASAQEDDAEARKRDLRTVVPSRREILDKLKQSKKFDMLVIGGGATGTGIALVRTFPFRNVFSRSRARALVFSLARVLSDFSLRRLRNLFSSVKEGESTTFTFEKNGIS